MQPQMIEIELLRGKGFPQPEDEPNPCTTQARVSLVSTDLSTVVCMEQCSSIQEKSNSPFFKDVLTFTAEDAELLEVTVQVKIVEFSRKSEPYVLLYGELPLSFSEFRTKRDVVVSLSKSCPSSDDGEARQRRPLTPSEDEQPSLSLRVQTRKAKPVEVQAQDADVQINEDDAVLKGSTQIVPVRCEYVWLRLTNDKKWTEGFRYALSLAWKGKPPLAGVSVGVSHQPKSKTTASTAPNGAPKRVSLAGPAIEADVRSIGDVVKKKWGCKHVYQVLTRVRLSAEKYSRGETNLTFTREEEVVYRAEKKARAHILETISLEALARHGSCSLRDWLVRLWVIFAVGVDNDPAGPKTLSYDTRKNVSETVFEDDDAVLLQASLLYFFVPTLPFEECQSIAEQEIRALLLEPRTSTEEKSSKWETRVTEDQRRFSTQLVSFVGSLMETLTETELQKALKTFKPAVQDCFLRIAKGGKLGIKLRLHSTDSSYHPKGDGIKIKHLDKLGRRKETAKFV